MVITSTFWKSHGGLGHSSRSEEEQLGSCKELLSTVPVRLPLITGESCCWSKKSRIPGVLSHDLFSQPMQNGTSGCVLFSIPQKL